MFCSKCGFKNSDDVAFCQKCGNKFGTSGDFEDSASVFTAPVIKKPTLKSSNPVLNTVKTLGSSPLYIVAIISFSMALLFDFISLLTFNQGIFGYIYGLAEKVGMEDVIYEYLEPVKGVFSATSFLGMIPSIIVAIGMWMIFASAADGKTPYMKTSGLTMIKVINIINLVVVCIWLAVIETIFIIGIVQASKSYIASDMGTGALIVLDIIALSAFFLVILYYGKIISSINNIKSTINTAKANYKISSYVAVITFVCAGFDVISVFFTSGASNILSKLLSAVSMICFGILIFRYKSTMKAQIISSAHAEV